MKALHAHETDFHWNPARLTALCDAWGDGSTLETISCIIGCSRGAIGGRLNRLRCEAARHDLTNRRTADMLADGRSLEEIANIAKVSVAAVEVRLADIRRGLGPQAR